MDKGPPRYIVDFEEVGRDGESWTSTYFIPPHDLHLINDAKMTARLMSNVINIHWGEDERGPCGFITVGVAPRMVGKCRRVGDWGD